LLEIIDHKFEDAARMLHQGIAIEQKWPRAVVVGSAREAGTDDDVDAPWGSIKFGGQNLSGHNLIIYNTLYVAQFQLEGGIVSNEKG